MMKMLGRVTGCCVALFLVLTSVSAAHKRLDSIKDLKKIDFGQSVPRHSLLLLHWFANTVDIDYNDDIWVTFDLNRDYGSHHYGNFEGLLDPLPWGYQYYILGSLNQARSSQLPSYVVDPPRGYEGRNRDRIIIRVQEQSIGWRAMSRIDQMYITQHYGTSESSYDPAHTYQITVDLLRQIREFSVTNNQLSLLQLRNRYGTNIDESYIRQNFGDLAYLGLFVFIVIGEIFHSNQFHYRLQSSSRQERNCSCGDCALATCFLVIVILAVLTSFLAYSFRN